MSWPKGPYRWVEDDRECISVPFTWNLPEVRQHIIDGGQLFGKPIVGGPAVRLMPDYLADIAEIGGDMPGVLQRINPLATRTMVGCPNDCGFCGVSRIEPEFRELDEWPNRPIVCDNNLLACSRRHFDCVIDGAKLIDLEEAGCRIDFNQGLDARLMTQYHADRLAELDAVIRLSWDRIGDEENILRAVARLRKAGIWRNRIRVYVLIGYCDTPKEALYRLDTVYWSLGLLPNPMRYVPLNSMTSHFVDDNWTDAKLVEMMRAWSNVKQTPRSRRVAREGEGEE